jgi:hypothetical protein
MSDKSESQARAALAFTVAALFDWLRPPLVPALAWFQTLAGLRLIKCVWPAFMKSAVSNHSCGALQ